MPLVAHKLHTSPLRKQKAAALFQVPQISHNISPCLAHCLISYVLTMFFKKAYEPNHGLPGRLITAVCANSVAPSPSCFALSFHTHPALFNTLHPCIIHSGYMKQSSFEEQCCIYRLALLRCAAAKVISSSGTIYFKIPALLLALLCTAM